LGCFAGITTYKETQVKVTMMVMGIVALAGIAQTALAADGKEIYTKNCGACHNAMKPKLGDKAAWASLNKQGVDELTAVAIKGKGAMPPKGGKAALSDADVKAAVQYMMDQGK
jgi:cytochrome c5